MKQTTIKKEISFEGIGLHSGKNVSIKLVPAQVDSGIIFKRIDLPNQPTIRAIAENVTATVRATTLEECGAKVFTVEHLLSALHVLKIDNCIIEMNAEEPPVLMGNAFDFFMKIKSVGLIEQTAERNEVIINKIYRVEDKERFIIALPFDGLRVSFTSINPHKLVGIQYQDFIVDEDIYEREIAPARTIAYEKEVDMLRSMGLGLGGTLENVIVYNDERWLNDLLYVDELVRHKILDVIGDLRLVGIIKAHIIASASGHALNTKLAKMIYSDFNK